MQSVSVGKRCEAEPTDPVVEEALLQRWEPLARQVASRFQRAAEREDLEQIARLALLRAARSYDPGRGCQFSTFAVRRMLGAIQHYVRDQAPSVRVPRRWWDLHRHLHQEAAAFAHAAGREPTIAELAERLGASEEDVASTLEVHVLLRPMSLNDPCLQPESTSSEAVGANVGEKDRLLETAEERLLLQQAMAELPLRHRDIVRRRFLHGLTQQEVAATMGLSEIHVSRLEHQALAWLRQYLHGAWHIDPSTFSPTAVPLSQAAGSRGECGTRDSQARSRLARAAKKHPPDHPWKRSGGFTCDLAAERHVVGPDLRLDGVPTAQLAEHGHSPRPGPLADESAAAG